MGRNDVDLFERRLPKHRRSAPRTEGERLRDEGAEAVLNRAGEEFQVEGLSVISALANSGIEFTIEAVHARMTTKPHHPNAWGALMRVAHQNKIIRIVGRKKAVRTMAHARVIPIYRGMAE